MTTDADKTPAQMVLEMKSIQGQEIAKDYDLSLLHDMEEDGDSWKACFAVGEQADLSAGIRGGPVSPWFSQDLEAWAWCKDNEAYLEGLYGENGALTL